MLQSFTLHTFVRPPPCLAHLPLLCAAVLQLPKEQNPRAPCFLQSPRVRAAVLQLPKEQNPFAPCFAQTRLATTLLGQSGVEHNTLMSCAWHTPLPLLLAFLLHPHTEQIPWAPCMVQTNLPGTAGVLQGGIAWQKPPAPPCFRQYPPLFCAFVLQLIILHLPFAPCCLHTPCAYALAEQPSTAHGFFGQCVLQRSRA